MQVSNYNNNASKNYNNYCNYNNNACANYNKNINK